MRYKRRLFDRVGNERVGWLLGVGDRNHASVCTNFFLTLTLLCYAASIFILLRNFHLLRCIARSHQKSIEARWIPLSKSAIFVHLWKIPKWLIDEMNIHSGSFNHGQLIPPLYFSKLVFWKTYTRTTQFSILYKFQCSQKKLANLIIFRIMK